MWAFLDSNFFQAFVMLLAVIAAFWVGLQQIKINKLISRTQDIVELYATAGVEIYKKQDGNTDKIQPIIYIQNVGTRLIYLDRYIFNGRIYNTDRQILPSTYSQALNNFYRIDLPVNKENHVSLQIFYHDVDNRHWTSEIFTDFISDRWQIKTLPRKKHDLS